MKSIKTVSPYLFLFTLFFSLSTMAVEGDTTLFGYKEDAYGPKANSITFTPLFGIYTNGNGQDLVDPWYDTGKIWSMGFRAGYSFTPEIEVEGMFVYTPTRTFISDQDVYYWGANGIYQRMFNRYFVPYGTFGVGGIVFDDDVSRTDHDFAINYGVGFKMFIYKNLALRPDARAITSFSNTHTAGVYTINFTYYSQIDREGNRDSDGDGMLDKFDKCPSQPETKNGYQDQDGCPDEVPTTIGDHDGDGIPDDKDKCPDQPETVNGFEDSDGCPDVVPTATPTPAPTVAATPFADRDHDGVPDEKDKCPDKPETVNGYKDEDGCPDRKSDEFQGVMDGIHFQSGAPIIEESSYTLLDRAVDFLKSVPTLRIRIDGHTDNTGTATRNKYLAYQRAQSVMEYFTHRGVAKDRIEIKGFGPARPIASNRTKEGRAKNRRVEFKFLNPEVLPKE